MNRLLSGVMPVAPTVFDDHENLDLEGQARVVDYLVAAGVDAVCILANYSEQFSLADDERAAVMDATLERVAGRVPVAVTTSHYSARIAAARSRAAQQRGASLVMLMAPFFGTSVRATDDGVVEYKSAHIDGVESELVVRSPHSCQGDPHTMEEVRRILRLHAGVTPALVP